MKRLFAQMVRTMVGRPVIWRLVNGSVVRAGEYFSIQRNVALEKMARQFAGEIFREKKVLHGPFKGMEYPGFESVGSFLYPKLLGSYEKELQPVIEELCRLKPPLVVDIGCAEGYYAVGFALRNKETKVVAFDIEPNAQELCGSMARLNGVEGRADVRGACDETCLSSLDSASPGLVISDCEGAERRIFSRETVPALKYFHLLIETHDRVCPGTSDYLAGIFSGSHEIETITSVTDDFKVANYHFSEIAKAEPWLKMHMLQECRGVQMKWLYMKPRTPAR